ncbi:MAG: large subunit ribosomal protein L18 [Lentimonas sp.]|jgi:large subunit ribosomal protein L18
MSTANSGFKKRQLRVRNNIKSKNKSLRSKISVFRSNKNIYAQLIDIEGRVLYSYSSMVADVKEIKGMKGVEIATFIGEKFAKICVEGGVKEVVFDKGSYLYSGRVKAVAEACRKAGLQF